MSLKAAMKSQGLKARPVKRIPQAMRPRNPGSGYQGQEDEIVGFNEGLTVDVTRWGDPPCILYYTPISNFKSCVITGGIPVEESIEV